MLKYVEDFTVEDLGIQEQFVYDIEVEDNHNFFGNGICVHNSLYVCLSDFVDMMLEKKPNLTTEQIVNLLDKYCAETLTKVINDAYAELFDYMNHYENLMVMKREVISEVAVWTGKKHYFMHMWDKEGTRYHTPKLKAMGMATVKSDTPYACREKLKDVLAIILSKSEKDLQRFISDFKEEYEQLPVEDISIPKKVSDIGKYYLGDGKFASGCPIHVRASGIWNNYIEKNSLDKRYEMIDNDDSVKYIYMRLPNTLKENVFGYKDYFPEEIYSKLKRYIDYDTQFEKTFVKPITDITKVIGWNAQQEFTSFF